MEDAELRAQQGDKLTALQQLYSPYMPLVSMARNRLRPEHERDELGTLAVWYKTVGEIAMLAQNYKIGEELLSEAVRLFGLVSDFDCTSLVDGCKMLLGIAQTNSRPIAHTSSTTAEKMDSSHGCSR